MRIITSERITDSDICDAANRNCYRTIPAKTVVGLCRVMKNVSKIRTAQSGSYDGLVIADTGRIKIPLILSHTFDRGDIYSLLTEILPSYNEVELSCFPFFDELGLKVTEYGRHDLLVCADFSSFDEHRKNLSQVARKWPKVIDNGDVTYEWRPDTLGIVGLQDLCRRNYSHFLERKGLHYDFYEDEYLFLSKEKLSNTEVFIVRHHGRLLAVGYFCYCEVHNELYWLMSHINRNSVATRYSIGNFILLSALQRVYERGMRALNLGMDVELYKSVWKPMRVARRGLDHVDSSSPSLI